jgi:hypothetical protein
VTLRESKDVVENYEADLRIAAQREDSQRRTLESVGVSWARNRGYGPS